MEDAIRNITKLLYDRVLSLNEANDMLLKLFKINKKSDEVEKKYAIGDNVRVMSNEEPFEAVITKIDWDDLNCIWKYYFIYDGELVWSSEDEFDETFKKIKYEKS